MGKIDDELTNETHKTISIKTFVSLCCIFNIPIILVDDDVKTMCLVGNDAQNSVHIREGNSCIMWNNDLNDIQNKLNGYQNIMPDETTFTLQLLFPTKNKTTPTPITMTQSTIKPISSYKLEELQTMCIARNISYTDIRGTGKGNKILKKDLYDSIINQIAHSDK